MTVLVDFKRGERVRQSEYCRRGLADRVGYEGVSDRFRPEFLEFNLAPTIRADTRRYFFDNGITWQRYADYAHSSQVCCLNFLVPLATRPDVLSKLVGHALGIDPPKMLIVEPGAFGKPWYVGFEWVGQDNYLGEWPKNGRPTRGAYITSADAVVRFRHAGRDETLLIEWKYTEEYGAPIKGWDNPKSMATRLGCYGHRVFAPVGPIRNDMGLKLKDFYWEPFYQFMRQQTLAALMQRAQEDGAQRVRVLHISPARNLPLHKVTAPALRQFSNDAFEAFSAVLAHRADFISRSTESVFGPLLATMAGDPWADYLTRRYSFLAATDGSV